MSKDNLLFWRENTSTSHPPSTLVENLKQESIELKEDVTLEEEGSNTYENTRFMGKHTHPSIQKQLLLRLDISSS